MSLFSRAEADAPGGLLSGKDPTTVDPSDPLRLWIIQVGIIVALASVLNLGLRRIRQPKVVAEVLGGILLGPTAFGRIPGFTQHIFPEASIPYLTLTANIGLCLFLFLVGLEIDASVVKRNARLSAAVALAGMILPFGLGTGLSVPLYHHFIDQSVKYTNFMLFTGVAYSITAFPVLCRILLELKLLDTTVGIVVLSAGVGNDIVGWTLLALSVALVNAGSGLQALWILLSCLGFTIFALTLGRFALRWLGKITGSIESGPSMLFMTVTMMTMLGASFFTDAVGVHPIFGAFITGLIVPREGGLAIALTEKLEDMVAVIFLPLYFTLSGLNTNLGLLDNGLTWGYTIAIMSLAFTGKFGGCTLGAHFVARFNWRESATIGALMSCKGLVELIVLNIGLSAGILNQRVFSMFVLEALTLTCLTTPLVTTLYPPKYRVRIAKSGANFNNVADDVSPDSEKSKKKHNRGKPISQSQDHIGRDKGGEEDEKTRFTVVLDRIEHLPGAMAVAQLINPMVYGFDDDELDLGDDSKEEKESKLSNKLDFKLKRSSISMNSFVQSTTSASIVTPIINVLRVIKFTDRVSAVMKSHETSTLLHSDVLLSVYRMFALFQGINVFGEVNVVPEDDMAGCVLEKASEFGAEMLVIPWVLHSSNSPANALVLGNEGFQSQAQTPKGNVSHNPFDTLFGKTGIATAASPETQPHSRNGFWSLAPGTSLIHTHFIRNVFARSDVDVGLYIDQSGIISTSFLDSDLPPGSAAGTGPLNFGVGLNVNRHGRGRVHIFLPFVGGPDDRLALEFVVGLCRKNERLRATVLRLKKIEGSFSPIADVTIPRADEVLQARNEEVNATTIASVAPGFPDTVYGLANTEVRLQSDTADNVLWARYATPQATSSVKNDGSLATSSVSQIPRMSFKEITTTKPLHAALEEAHALQCLSANHRRTRNGGSSSTAGVGVVIVAGRSRRLAVEGHRAELKELMQEDSAGSGSGEVTETSSVREVKKTVGEVGSAFVGRGVGVGVWVVQAALEGGR